jgi:hypothetical protein
MNPIQLLHLDRITLDPRLMRLLPAEIAYRYQALPISTDGGRITIAMAHPEDTTACNAVTAALGKPSCLVQADQGEIKRLLGEVWPQNSSSPLRFMVWNPATTSPGADQSFSGLLGELLHADLIQANIPWRGSRSLDAFLEEATRCQPDLVIFHIPTPSLLKRLSIDFTVNKLIEGLPSSILIVKNPRWPLKKMLLTIRDSDVDNQSTLEWVVRLARCSQAAVTIMPLVPPVPEMYGSLIRNSLPALLTANDPFGKKMRWIAHRLASQEVEGTFKLRNGYPLEQLRSEVLESDTDLVITAADPQNHIWHWILGELVNDLFVWLDRPLLITKPITH